jgi:Tfp pilus assembly protein PilN
MTTAAAELSLTGHGFAVLPRVNLLPPEIGERKHLKNVQIGLGGVVAAAFLVVGGLYLLAGAQVSSAQDEVAAADADHSRLVQQTATYAEVRSVYAKAAAAQSTLSTAMGHEVRYSQLLDDLSRKVPANVFLKTITFTQTDAGAIATPGAPGGAIGSITATGVAYSHDDVALWLDQLGTLDTYSGSYLSTSVESVLGGRKVVDWTTTSSLQSTAYSDRYSTPAGG